jgi:hypothetical protein
MLDAMAHPGPKQCRWCPHANNCVSRANYVHEAIFEDFADVTAPPVYYCSADGLKTAAPAGNTQKKDAAGFAPEVLAAMLERVEVIAQFAKDLQSEGLKRLQGGLSVPGWKLVKGRKGPRQWVDESAAEEALKKAKLKADDMYNKKVISPTQSEKVLKERPRVWGKLQANIKQSDGAEHLAPESDKRPAITTGAAFEDVSQ